MSAREKEAYRILERQIRLYASCAYHSQKSQTCLQIQNRLRALRHGYIRLMVGELAQDSGVPTEPSQNSSLDTSEYS